MQTNPFSQISSNLHSTAPYIALYFALKALLTIFWHLNSPQSCVWAQTYTSFSSNSATVCVVWMEREFSDGSIVGDQLKLCSSFHFCDVDCVVCDDAISVLWKWWHPAQNKCPRVCRLDCELKRSCLWNCMWTILK